MTSTVPVTTRPIAVGGELSPATVDQNFEDLSRVATNTVSGKVQLASQDETVNGTGGDNVVQSQHFVALVNKLLSEGGSIQNSKNGYWIDPLTGFTIQWGYYIGGSSGTHTEFFTIPSVIEFPIEFPTKALGTFLMPKSSSSYFPDAVQSAVSDPQVWGVQLDSFYLADLYWFAWGY